MLFRKFAFLYFLLLSGTLSCTSPNADPVQDVSQNIAEWPHAVTYEIFVQSFADGNGDSIGDIRGMTQKLDYLDELGVQAVWLMPIGPSPSYHKYDVTDYRAIHTDYGTLDDFKNFVEQAHEKNIKVIIDLVVNHTDQHHPWFQESIKGPDNPYRGYYVWADADSVRTARIAEGRMEAGADYIPEWHTREGNDEIYYGFFWQGMPDLNYDNPAVRKEIIEIGKFWLKEVGVDGFRLDAALYIFPKNRVEETTAWWEEFRAEMEKVNEDVYLVGEVWAETETTAPFLNGLDAVFNFDMGFEIVKTIRNEIDSGLVNKHIDIRTAYAKVNPEFVDATFLTNHDQNRIMSQIGDSAEKARLAASILMTLPGSPYIYYGEELGMRGEKPDELIREPFLWKNEGDSLRTKWRPVKYNTDSATIPLEQQQADPNSLYQHYRQLISLRNTSYALTYGDLKNVEDGSDKVVSFIRSYENETLLVMHNISSEPIEVTIPAQIQDFTNMTWQAGKNSLTNSGVRLAPYGSIVVDKR